MRLDKPLEVNSGQPGNGKRNRDGEANTLAYLSGATSIPWHKWEMAINYGGLLKWKCLRCCLVLGTTYQLATELGGFALSTDVVDQSRALVSTSAGKGRTGTAWLRCNQLQCR